MLNSPRDTIGIALIMSGHSLNATDAAALEDAKQLLIEQKPLVLAYVVDEVKDKMIAGEAAVAMVWSGDATFSMAENDELDYVVPEEGSNIFFDAICIPANAKNVSGAEKFIDFLCRADIAAKNYEYVGYAIPNKAAIEVLGADEYNASPVNNPPQEVLDKCEVFKYLGEDTKLYDQVWTEIISVQIWSYFFVSSPRYLKTSHLSRTSWGGLLTGDALYSSAPRTSMAALLGMA
jgi:spermidine/putrescine transport system substrate-binding protein